MQPADYIAIAFGLFTVFGGVFGFMWHILDKARTVAEVKDQTIAAQAKTIESQDRQIIVLEASGTAAKDLIVALHAAIEGGGSG